MQKYCFQCMKALPDHATFCPRCGYKLTKQTTIPYHLPAGTILANKYLVGNVLGEGGFGITYIGLDTVLSKRVAIKEFYPSGAANRTNEKTNNVLVSQGKEDFFQKGVDRFLMEAKSVATFSAEDGIVDVLDFFDANNTAYIVMEYLDGKTLKDHIAENGVFPAQQIIEMMLPVMKSLKTIHAQGVIHRDISPDNIMLTKSGKLKLMDFGSARYYTNEERQMSVVLKQGFAPEEQYRRNGNQGPYTDVYALCATIYACITGNVPPDSLARLAGEPLKAPSTLGFQISEVQENALLHGLALLAENRTPDMDTLIQEFTAKDSKNVTIDANSISESYRDKANEAEKQRQAAQAQQPFAQQPMPNTAYPAWQQQQQIPPTYYPPQYPYPPTQQQPPQKKSNTGVVVAIVLTAVAILAVLGVMAFIFLNKDKDDKNNTESTAPTQLTTVADSGASGGSAPTSTDPVETTTQPPETSTQPEPSTSKPDHDDTDFDPTDLSHGEIDSICSSDIAVTYSKCLTDSDYNNNQRQTGKYAYVALSSGEEWIATPEYTMIDEYATGKDGKMGGNQRKKWFFYNTDGTPCFVLDTTSSTNYRYYIYKGKVIKCTVGSQYEGNQYNLYPDEGAFPDSKASSIVTEAKNTYSYVAGHQ